MKKILVCGSHFTIAHAVIEKLIKSGDAEISYIGRRQTMEGDRSVSVESEIIPRLGVKYYSLTTGRVSRSMSVGALVSLFKIPLGFWGAFWLIQKIRPDVVLSFGGYVSVPVVVMAKLLGIKVMLHEQTLISGLANKFCGLFADKIAVSYAEGKYEFAKNKIVFTGNPIRKSLLLGGGVDSELKEFLGKKGPLIYVTGGNQGAQAINNAIGEILANLCEKMRVVWQTGDSKQRNFEIAKMKVESLEDPKKVFVRKWFDAADVGEIMRSVDLVVSRAGINTLNELAFFHRRAIAIPYPSLYRDEQLVNGRYFEKLGLVKVIEQDKLKPETLLAEIGNQLKRGQVKKLHKDIVVVDAASQIENELMKLIRK